MTTNAKVLLMDARRTYSVELTVNGLKIAEVVIDPHYESKHSVNIDDTLILKLVQQLDEQYFKPEALQGRFQYFVADPLRLDGRNYRLVWLLEDEKLYVGVVNAFRR